MCLQNPKFCPLYQKSCIISSNPGNYSKNLFIDNDGIAEGEKAIDQSTGGAAPVITEVVYSYKKYIVRGTSSTSQVEVFLSNGPQTATKYLGESNVSSGAFEVEVDEGLVAGDNICFIACGVVTELGDPFCEIKDLNYYVKTVAEGDGSGSSWENAMSPESFATKLPKAEDGSVFHVAEGTYKPIKVDLDNLNENIGSYIEGVFYLVKSGITVIGGYDKDAKMGDFPDPALNKTIFSGDLKEDDGVWVISESESDVVVKNATDNSESLFVIDNEDQVKFSGCTFEHVYGVSAVIVNSAELTLEQCEFTLNLASNAHDGASCLSMTGSSSVLMENCYIHDNFGSNAYGAIGLDFYKIGIDEQKKLTINNCTFEHNYRHNGIGLIGVQNSSNLREINVSINQSTFNENGNYYGTSFGLLGIDGSSKNVEFKVENSTFIKNHFYKEGTSTPNVAYVNDANANVDFNNCTFVSNVASENKLAAPIFLLRNGNLTLSHNIIVANDDDFILWSGQGKLTTKNNLLSSLNTNFGGAFSSLDASDIVYQDLFTDVLDGTATTGKDFIANLADNGGKTKTVKLVNDELPNGVSLRFPLAETEVTTDQRGVLRAPNACLGAYEIKDMVKVNGIKTICLKEVCDTFGISISGEDAGVGEHQYSRFVSGTTVDTLYSLSLTVYPCNVNLNSLAFYVKIDGKGDGSSWKEAMSPEDFDYALPRAKSGSIFYVAEGTYKPSLKANFNSYSYEIKSDVTILGGYPATAKDGDIAYPQKYKTIISADRNGDDNDVYTEENLDINYSDLKYKNIVFDASLNDNVGVATISSDVNQFVIDNPAALLYVTKESNVKLKGLVFSNAYHGGNISAVNSELTVSNCEFCKNTYGHNLSAISVTGSKKLVIDSTSFHNNILYGGFSQYMSGSLVSGSDITIKNSNFELNDIYVVSILTSRSGRSLITGTTIDIEKSSFVKNYSNNVEISNRRGGLFDCSLLKCNNCTFANNNMSHGSFSMSMMSPILCTLEESKSASISNCTFVCENNVGNPMVYLCGGDLSLKNNIIETNTVPLVFWYSGSGSLEIKNNIISSLNISSSYSNRLSTLQEDLSSQIYSGDFTSILDGTINEDGIFKANAKNNGGFTPTVKLLTTSLTDGHSLLVPLTETEVTTDQRGVLRAPNTCLGAYEIKDTVKVDVEASVCRGETYNKYGFKISTVDSLGGTYTYSRFASGSEVDSLYSLSLTISPVRCGIDTKALAYYVKTKAWGTGDGSRWEDAISAEDFAAVLPVAVEGATFYVAKGNYKPIYTTSGDIDEKNPSNLTYLVNHSVTIHGGFPADAETGAVSDPEKYPTTFEGDILDNDSEDSDTWKDNTNHMFFSYSTDKLNLTLEGVQIEHTNGSAVNLLNTEKSLLLENDHFSENYSYVVSMPTSEDKVIVRKSVFEGNKQGLEVYNTNLTVDSCKFLNNEGAYIFGNTNTTSINHSIIDGNNIGSLFYGIKCDVKLENSTLANNISISSDGNLFLFIYGEHYLYNNTIVNNTSGVYLMQVNNGKLYNNTIVGNDGRIAGNDIGKQTLVGNIILGNKIDETDICYIYANTFYKIEEFSNNVMNVVGDVPFTLCNTCSFSTLIPKDNSNIFIRQYDLENDRDNTTSFTYVDTEDKVLASLFEGTYDSKTHVFKVDLAYNGGFTPTAKLKNDILPDVTSIRFALSQTKVTEDQRGVKRLSVTCPGAYEMVEDHLTLESGEEDKVIKDRTCFNPNNSKVTINVSGWTSKCKAVLLTNSSDNTESQIVTPKSVDDNNIAQFEFLGLEIGNYELKVTNNFLDEISQTFSLINEINEPEIKLVEDESLIDLICDDSSDGKISLMVTGGDASTCTFTMNDEEIELTGNTFKKDGLAVGKYSLVYKSKEDGCKDNVSLPVDIQSNDHLKVAASLPDVTCAGVKGVGTITISEGSAPYNYTISNTTSPEVEAYKGETSLDNIEYDKFNTNEYYDVVVSDANGCTVSVNNLISHATTIGDLSSLIDVSVSAQRQTCYEMANGSIVATVSGTSIPENLKFVLEKEGDASVAKVPVNNVANFSNLGEGVYSLYVDYIQEGCETTNSQRKINNYEITKPEKQIEIDEDYLVITNPTCFSNPNGSASMRVLNWDDAYTITIDDGINDPYVTNEPYPIVDDYAYIVIDPSKGGNYKVTIANTCGYKLEKKIDIPYFEKPSFKLVDSKTVITCPSYSSDYKPEGYGKYQFEGGSDNVGSIGFSGFNTKTKTYVKESVSDDGKSVFYITANPSAASTGYELNEEYSLAVKKDAIYYFENLDASTYYLAYISGDDACKDDQVASLEIKENPGLKVDVVASPIICGSMNTAEVTLVPHKSNASIEYVTEESGTSKNYASELYNNKCKNGDPFEGFETITIGHGDDVTQEAYEHSMDESINYALSDFPNEKFWQMKVIDGGGVATSYPKAYVSYSNLVKGSYYVTMTDVNTCHYKQDFAIKDDPTFGTLSIKSLAFNEEKARCIADSCRIKVNVSGGWGGYTYTLNEVTDKNYNTSDPELNDDVVTRGGTSDPNFKPDTICFEKNGEGFYQSDIVAPGKYYVSVMDSKGCYVTDSINIVKVDPNILVSGEITLDPCGRDSANSVEVHVNSANGYELASPYTYQIRYSSNDRKKDVTTTKDDAGYDVVGGLPTGKQGIYVYDANGCSGYGTFLIGEPDYDSPYNITVLDSKDALCYGESSGEVSLNVFGSYPPYVDLILDGKSRKDGEKSFYSINALGATVGSEWELTDKGIPGVVETDESQNSETVYRFTMENVNAGNHKLKFVDSKGCDKEISFAIGQPDPLVVEAFGSYLCEGGEGNISPKSVTGGTEPYTYSLSEDGPFEDVTAINAPVGSYNLYVQDANQCIGKSQTVKVEDKDIEGGPQADYIVSSWMDKNDVLALVDLTRYNSDQTLQKIDIDLDFGENTDMKWHLEDRRLYLYGVQEDNDSKVVWRSNGDVICKTSDGGKEILNDKDVVFSEPTWGIPNNIVSGVRSEEEYMKENARIISSLQSLYDKLANLDERSSSYNADKQNIEDAIAQEKESWRYNCTIDMVTNKFDLLVNPNEVEHLYFIKLDYPVGKNAKYDYDKLEDEILDFSIKYIATINGCQYKAESHDEHVSNNGYTPFGDINSKDIYDFSVDNKGENITVDLYNKTDFKLNVYNFNGQLQSEYSVSKEVLSEKIDDDETLYRASLKVGDFYSKSALDQTSIIMVYTKSDSKAKTFVINP